MKKIGSFWKGLLAMGLVLGCSGIALGLPSNSTTLTTPGADLRVSVNFAGMEIDYGTVTFDVGAPVFVGQGGAIGYVPAAFYPSPAPGAPGGLFVFFNAAGTVLADVNSLGASSTPGVVPNMGAMLANPANVFTTFGVGTIDNLQNPDGTIVSFPQTYPGAPATTQQLTFVLRDLQLAIQSPTAASFEASIDGSTGFGTGTLTTQFVPNSGVISIYEDATTDVDSRAAFIPAAGGAPAGELPTAFFDPNSTGLNQYFDNVGANGKFRFGDPSDAAETEVMRLAHTGGMIGTDVFNADLDTPGGTLTVVHPTLGPLTLWVGGRTSFSDPSASLFLVPGIGWGGSLLDPGVGFRITSDVGFGKTQTGQGNPSDPGVDPNDPLTFTFQTPRGGGPEIFGGNVIIPEPLTMLGLLMGSGALAGYIRKRRSA